MQITSRKLPSLAQICRAHAVEFASPYLYATLLTANLWVLSAVWTAWRS